MVSELKKNVSSVIPIPVGVPDRQISSACALTKLRLLILITGLLSSGLPTLALVICRCAYARQKRKAHVTDTGQQ